MERSRRIGQPLRGLAPAHAVEERDVRGLDLVALRVRRAGFEAQGPEDLGV